MRIMDTSGLMFPKPKDLKKDVKEVQKIYKMKNKSSKRAKACDIPLKVKKKVLLRDKGICIICGKSGVPNSHYVRRGQGGLGIEENVVCMCIDCHNAYDNGKDDKKAENIKKKIKSYLKRQYGKTWNEKKLYYKK